MNEEVDCDSLTLRGRKSATLSWRAKLAIGYTMESSWSFFPVWNIEFVMFISSFKLCLLQHNFSYIPNPTLSMTYVTIIHLYVPFEEELKNGVVKCCSHPGLRKQQSWISWLRSKMKRYPRECWEWAIKTSTIQVNKHSDGKEVSIYPRPQEKFDLGRGR